VETLRRLRDIDGSVGAVISKRRQLGRSYDKIIVSHGFAAALPKTF